MSSKRTGGSPLAALSQAFFGQFFTSESVTSDIQLRQAIVWVLAFLLTPGLLLMIQVFPHYQYIFIRAAVLHAPGMVEDMLDWLAFVFVTYSMASMGLIAAFMWDSLGFDRRDALVLGPLPLRPSTIITAKLTALGVLLAAASTAVNLPNALLFAVETSDQAGGAVLVGHFTAQFHRNHLRCDVRALRDCDGAGSGGDD